MELTLDQALQKGIEAHKAGKAQEADQYYTAILKANPRHPDANHNMGVLAVGVGKVETALPFFKTALEINPNITQFWLSYIDALIKLDRMEEAKDLFNQAKRNNVQGDGFDQLENRLGTLPTNTEEIQNPPEEQLRVLIELYKKERFQKRDHKYTENHQITISVKPRLEIINIIKIRGRTVNLFTPIVHLAIERIDQCHR